MDDRVKRAVDLIEVQDKPDEGVALLNEVLWEEPDNAKALFALGTAIYHAGRDAQALQILKRACDLEPRKHWTWKQLCVVAGGMHLYEDAVRYAKRALELKRSAESLSDLAFAYLAGGDYEQADKYSKEALALDPALDDALRHQGSIHLARQQWAEGWKGFRLTLRTKWRKEWTYGDSVEWDGSPGKIVMVTTEQGLGDEVMFASMVPDAIRDCKTFILDCDHRLYELYRRSFPDALVVPTRREQTVRLPLKPECHFALGQLGEIYRLKNEDFPRTPYLVPNPHYVAMFKALLRSQCGEGPVIGLAWSGGCPHTGKTERAAGLNAFAPLIRRGGATFLSLQYKDDRAEVAEFKKQYGVQICRVPWVAQSPDMDLLAGLIAACDEIVGVHTTALHLSSAMGIPTTTLTHRGSGWRYHPQELLWYPPTTQLFKKQKGESWRDCVCRLVEQRKHEPLAA